MASEDNPYAAPKSSVDTFSADATTVPGPHNYATRAQRFVGSLIDGILIIIPFLLLFLVFGGFDNIFSEGTEQLDGIGAFLTEESIRSEVVQSLFGVVLLVAINGYVWHTRSQSIGKILTKTKIVNLDGSPANFSNIFYKRTLIIHLLIMIPGIGTILSLVDALMIFREEHNCLHDDIAKTRVVKIDPAQ